MSFSLHTWVSIGLAFVVLSFVGGTSLKAQSHNTPEVSIVLPTDNDALFRGGGEAFYMRTNRRPRQKVNAPWTAGMYGFVRNPVFISSQVIYRRFHEGIDIVPLQRSANGEALDEIRTIADGEVVYVNNVARTSNYGKYIVIEHWWGQSPYYSLYSHLKSIHVEIGDMVKQGASIGVMGYTGVGLNRARSHLHLEINLMLNEAFNDWYDDYLKNRAPNHHEIFNGLNLVGMDVARLYLELKENPNLTIPEFLKKESPSFEVTIPAGPDLPDILWRYPWLCDELEGWMPEYGLPIEMGNSWKITFAASGFPLKFATSDRVVDNAEVNMIKRANVPYQYLTNGLVRGRGNSFTLTQSGRRRMDLLTRSFEGYFEPLN